MTANPITPEGFSSFHLVCTVAVCNAFWLPQYQHNSTTLLQMLDFLQLWLITVLNQCNIAIIYSKKMFLIKLVSWLQVHCQKNMTGRFSFKLYLSQLKLLRLLKLNIFKIPCNYKSAKNSYLQHCILYIHIYIHIWYKGVWGPPLSNEAPLQFRSSQGPPFLPLNIAYDPLKQPKWWDGWGVLFGA